MTFAYFWVALISAFLMVPPAKAQAPLDEFGFLEQWQILSEDFLLGKVTLNEKGMPDGYDTEAEKITEEGHFQVSVSPEAAPSPFNEIHTWLIKIESPDPIGNRLAARTLRSMAACPCTTMPLPQHQRSSARSTTGSTR